jgi:acetyl-CoA/propionyl-CoA carboxylase biotin carboxyl carrier protein
MHPQQVAQSDCAKMTATRIGEGVYRVEHEGRGETVYVAGPSEDGWAFWNGHVFRGVGKPSTPRPRAPRPETAQSLTAPMPATVLRVLVQPGAAVRKGDTLIILEAMKMELPIRATGDAVVTAVRCREGQLVHSDTVLIDLK